MIAQTDALSLLKKFSAAIVFTIFGSISLPAYAGTIFLSGDVSIVNPLVGSGGTGIDTGNQKFFTNILQGGNRVVVDGDISSFVRSTFSSSNIDRDLNSFYNSLPGVTSSIVTGTITFDVISNANLFVSLVPAQSYTTAELQSLRNFLDNGNSIFFLGDNNNLTSENSIINDELTALGSNLRIINDNFDAGFNTATGSQIASDSFTTGITTFTYAAPSRVSTVTGGENLFFGTNREAFVAYERTETTQTTVPEPSFTFSLLVLGTTLSTNVLLKNFLKK
jgi:hypothetical protein